MSESRYPECDKLADAQPEYGAIIDFLEWMGAQGIRRMKWNERTSTRTCQGNPWDFNGTCREGRRVLLIGPAHAGEQEKDTGPCSACDGTGVITTVHEDWEDLTESAEALVRRYFRIDPEVLEQERRAMLKSLQGIPREQHRAEGHDPVTKRTNQPRNAPKPGHRAPGGMYVDTQQAWNHLTDIGSTPTESTGTTSTSTPTTDSPPATSGE